MNDEDIDRAVAPNLFDVIVDPELVFALVLANLMSPRLWELREHILQPAKPEEEQRGGVIEHIHNVLDHHFEHVTPARVAEMNGVLDLDLLAERYGAATVEDALSTIISTLDWRIKRGNLEKDAVALELIRRRKFPAYTYATIDEAWANRRLLGRRKHKPLGLTCCLDEATIFAALLLTLPERAVENIAFLGSPTHYSLLAWTSEGARWFYSKHELYSPAGWAQMVTQSCTGNAQLAFDDRLPDFDRIITAEGTYQFASVESSISRSRLAQIVTKIDQFFGFRPSQLHLALQRPVRRVSGPDVPRVVAGASSAAGAEEARAHVRCAAFDQGNPVALRALYAFRTLDLPDLGTYLRAARQGTRIADALPLPKTTDDALGFVSGIEGNASIFEDRERIALPEETARFGTGTERDKALLLHVLLERALAADDPARANLETLLTDKDGFVRSARFCISIARSAYVPEAEGRVLHRIADSRADKRVDQR